MFRSYPSIRAFVSYAGRFKRVFWITAVTFAAADIIISLIPWFIGKLTNALTHPHNGNIVAWTAVLVVASIGHDMLWRTGEFLYLKLLQTPNYRFDDVIFSNVLQHDYSYFVDNFTGKISSYATSLGREFREMMDNFHYQYVNLIVALPIIIGTMFTVNVYTGAVFAVSLALMFLAGRKLAGDAAKAERAQADERSSIDGFVVDAIANFVSVKAFGSERREATRLHEKRLALISAAKKAFFKNILFWGGMSLFVRWIIWPATFILNVYLYTHGHMTLAQMTTFLAVIVLFSNFIWEVIWDISQLNIKIASVEEAYRYLFGERNIFADAPAEKSEKLSESSFQRELTLNHLSFAYPDKPDVAVLEDINLGIRRGEKIGIVGHSGGGKSTLLKLLLGYYPIEPGQLLLDGKAIDNAVLTDLTAYVPQDTAIFHRSISENIAYARPGASQAEIVQAARHAQADDFIRDLPQGYDTLVGERGVKLSGGQRQRIAIARAILKDAPLLMLDEATSALDSESEKLIQKALTDLLKNRTALVIAHRLSTIQHLDRIVVIDKGKVVEVGTHAELLKRNGFYAKLWQHQSGGFIEE
jgi:ABC-type multidrug transport system fused ATPase/permease subunit